MSKAAPPKYSDPALVPLRADSPYGGCSSEVLRLQAARPDTWRGTWPDEPRVIELRDLLTAHFRRAYRFQADSFLPDDDMCAIMIAAELDECHDEVEFVMEIEEALDVQIDDEMANRINKQTYLEFIEMLILPLSPEYLLRPLVLPDYFFKSGWRAAFRRWLVGGLHYDSLRRQQARRTPDWVEKWADHESLADLRDQVGQILVDQLKWPAPAFVPEDQAAALFYHGSGPNKTLAAIQALNQQFDADLTPEFSAAERTFLDLLQYIGRNKK